MVSIGPLQRCILGLRWRYPVVLRESMVPGRVMVSDRARIAYRAL